MTRASDPSREMTVPVGLDGARLVDICWAHLGAVTRRSVGPLIAEGGVLVDGIVGAIAQPVRSGQRIALDPSAFGRLTDEGRVIPPSPQPLIIVQEDAHVLVVDKPAGTHVHPMGPYREDTLLGGALWHAGARPDSPWTAFRPSPAHRLDRPTSGLVVFAKSIAVREVLQGLFERHEILRTYDAHVQGVPCDLAGTIEVPLGRDPSNPRRRAHVAVKAGGQTARSRWQVRGTDGRTAHLIVTLDTGRTHQIRAHLAHIGHPVVGDVLYGADQVGPDADPAVGSAIGLRAVSLEGPHPSGTGMLQITAT